MLYHPLSWIWIFLEFSGITKEAPRLYLWSLLKSHNEVRSPYFGAGILLGMTATTPPMCVPSLRAVFTVPWMQTVFPI